MLIHVSSRGVNRVSELPGEIHIVLSVLEDGMFLLKGYAFGVCRTTIGKRDRVSLLRDIPMVVDELLEVAKAKAQA